MTTATKALPKASALAELERREAAWAERSNATRERSGELKQKLDQQRELLEGRQHLIHRESGLVDHLGNPLEPDNVIAAIDGELAKLGDLHDLYAKVEHLRRLEQRAKQDVDLHRVEHYDELRDELRPQAEATVDAVHAAVRSTIDALNAYLSEHSRSVGLTEPIRGIDGRHVPGVNEASAMKRSLEAVALPVPVPGDRRLA